MKTVSRLYNRGVQPAVRIAKIARLSFVHKWVRQVYSYLLKNSLKPLLPKEPPFYLPVCAPVENRDPCIDCNVKASCHSDDRWQWLRQEMPA